jgi:hypothetical protein
MDFRQIKKTPNPFIRLENKFTYIRLKAALRRLELTATTHRKKWFIFSEIDPERRRFYLHPKVK